LARKVHERAIFGINQLHGAQCRNELGVRDVPERLVKPSRLWKACKAHAVHEEVVVVPRVVGKQRCVRMASDRIEHDTTKEHALQQLLGSLVQTSGVRRVAGPAEISMAYKQVSDDCRGCEHKRGRTNLPHSKRALCQLFP
jgi:hypothetical protein